MQRTNISVLYDMFYTIHSALSRFLITRPISVCPCELVRNRLPDIQYGWYVQWKEYLEQRGSTWKYKERRKAGNIFPDVILSNERELISYVFQPFHLVHFPVPLDWSVHLGSYCKCKFFTDTYHQTLSVAIRAHVLFILTCIRKRFLFN